MWWLWRGWLKLQVSTHTLKLYSCVCHRSHPFAFGSLSYCVLLFFFHFTGSFHSVFLPMLNPILSFDLSCMLRVVLDKFGCLPFFHYALFHLSRIKNVECLCVNENSRGIIDLIFNYLNCFKCGVWNCWIFINSTRCSYSPFVGRKKFHSISILAFAYMNWKE